MARHDTYSVLEGGGPSEDVVPNTLEEGLRLALSFLELSRVYGLLDMILESLGRTN